LIRPVFAYLATFIIIGPAILAAEDRVLAMLAGVLFGDEPQEHFPEEHLIMSLSHRSKIPLLGRFPDRREFTMAHLLSEIANITVHYQRLCSDSANITRNRRANRQRKLIFYRPHDVEGVWLLKSRSFGR